MISNKNLIAIELDLVALQVKIVLDFGEVEDTCQIEGIIHVEMNPEQRLVRHWEEFAVEFFVILLL